MRAVSWIKACHSLSSQHLVMPTLHQLPSRQQCPLRAGATNIGQKIKAWMRPTFAKSPGFNITSLASKQKCQETQTLLIVVTILFHIKIQKDKRASPLIASFNAFGS